MHSHLTAEVCRNVSSRTKEQSLSPLWYEVRYGRITASIFYEVSRCKTEGQLLEQIMGAATPFSSDAIERGKRLEKVVLNVVETKYNIKTISTGIHLSSEHPVFGASPRWII
ncbi:hypothetical protein NQ314_020987 [Rhamnusium bicolor]|uniref:Uncharacterized protein n=1 Tax=Rhamnusium bicolor TaxID=1586634 RepID=A0AAV8WJY5_9CUCU|nr:hypothetical protein NQ314_020987 [Rhamnusium bicolor]